MANETYSGLFHSSEHENKFFERFEALVEQFGVENIVVCLPTKWANDFRWYDDTVQIAFCTASEVKVIARDELFAVEESTRLNESSKSVPLALVA